MLRLFRGGPVIWMSPPDAAKIGVSDNDWIEAYNRNGVVTCRAVVTHRMPEGTVFMYHARARHLMTPPFESCASLLDDRVEQHGVVCAVVSMSEQMFGVEAGLDPFGQIGFLSGGEQIRHDWPPFRRRRRRRAVGRLMR